MSWEVPSSKKQTIFFKKSLFRWRNGVFKEIKFTCIVHDHQCTYVSVFSLLVLIPNGGGQELAAFNLLVTKWNIYNIKLTETCILQSLAHQWNLLKNMRICTHKYMNHEIMQPTVYKEALPFMKGTTLC